MSEKKKKKARSALGVGVTTLVTIMVVILLTTFSVLSLVTAQSDLRLTKMATDSTTTYYAADAAAEQWYSELDAALAAVQGDDYQAALTQAGYTVTRTDEGVLMVQQQFAMGTNRQLEVTVAIDDAGTSTIRQWQSRSAAQ
ncbi:MAG: hypothetical protein LBU48_05420 [Coriobacteriales bacterium]|jgi:hypothetical protein|nr:hypothetical protein [Coriobacteriales bacterium]